MKNNKVLASIACAFVLIQGTASADFDFQEHRLKTNERAAPTHYYKFLDKILSLPSSTRFALVQNTNGTQGILIIEVADGIEVSSYGIYEAEKGDWVTIRDVSLKRTYKSILDELVGVGLKELSDNYENEKFVFDFSTYSVSVKIDSEIRRFTVYAPHGHATLSHCKVINILFGYCDSDPSKCQSLPCRGGVAP